MRLEYNQLFAEQATLESLKGVRSEKKISCGRVLEEKITLPPSEECNKNDIYFNLKITESLYFKQDLKDILSDALANCLKSILAAYSYNTGDLVMVIGLGNQGMIADSLGAKTLSGLNITAHLIRKQMMSETGNLCALGSSVSGVTGIESYDIIRGVVDRLHPKIIIAVDTLSCSDIEKFQKIIQINNTGIEPGGGINNPKKKLSFSTLKIPVIAIGVPLVIYAKDILRAYLSDNKDFFPGRGASAQLNSLVVTSKEIDIVVEDFAKVIAKAINRCCSKN
ncbi:MAG: GPR endopeptidase [Christensenellales bacterium]|jgi:spore protease